MTSLTVSQAKSHLPELIRKADRGYQAFIITRNGLPKAVLMSYDELEGLLETIDISRDKRLVKSLKKSLKEADSGKVIAFSKIKKH
jgi:antitoxin YefM